MERLPTCFNSLLINSSEQLLDHLAALGIDTYKDPGLEVNLSVKGFNDERSVRPIVGDPKALQLVDVSREVALGFYLMPLHDRHSFQKLDGDGDPADRPPQRLDGLTERAG